MAEQEGGDLECVTCQLKEDCDDNGKRIVSEKVGYLNLFVVVYGCEGWTPEGVVHKGI